MTDFREGFQTRLKFWAQEALFWRYLVGAEMDIILIFFLAETERTELCIT